MCLIYIYISTCDFYNLLLHRHILHKNCIVGILDNIGIAGIGIHIMLKFDVSIYLRVFFWASAFNFIATDNALPT